MGYRLYARINGSPDNMRYRFCFGKLFGYLSLNGYKNSNALDFLFNNSTFLIENFTDGTDIEEVAGMFDSDFNFTAELSRLDFMRFMTLYAEEWENEHETDKPDGCLNLMKTALIVVSEPVYLPEEDCVMIEWGVNGN